MSLETICDLLGWCTLLGLGIMVVQTLVLIACRDRIAGLHAKMFQVDPDWVRQEYFRYLSRYKTLWMLFCLVPYLACRLVLP